MVVSKVPQKIGSVNSNRRRLAYLAKSFGDPRPKNTNSGRRKDPLHVINMVVAKLAAVQGDLEVYGVVLQALRELLPGVFIVCGVMQPDGEHLRVIKISGTAKRARLVQKNIAVDPFQVWFSIKATYS